MKSHLLVFILFSFITLVRNTSATINDSLHADAEKNNVKENMCSVEDESARKIVNGFFSLVFPLFSSIAIIYIIYTVVNNVDEDRKAKPKPKDVEASFSDFLIGLFQLALIHIIMQAIVPDAIFNSLFVCFWGIVLLIVAKVAIPEVMKYTVEVVKEVRKESLWLQKSLFGLCGIVVVIFWIASQNYDCQNDPCCS